MADFYTIRLEGKEVSETDEFFLRFGNDEKYKEDIAIIKRWIEKIGVEYGAKERHFRPEGRAQAIPIPPPKSKLRLYCIRLNEHVVILVNGGEKTSQKVKDSPDAFPHFNLANKVAEAAKERIRTGGISVENKQMRGKLALDIKI